MNELPIVPDPPFGFATDEAISAALDGELASFAADRGLTESEVQSKLDAWPGTDARRAELERGRGLVAGAIPPLDDVTRRRLVRGATSELAGGAAKTSRSRSWVAITAVAAAGLLVVAGIGVAISSTGGGEQTDATGSAARDAGERATEPLRGDVGDLGDVTDPAALRALLDRRELDTQAGGTASTTAPAALAPVTSEDNATGGGADSGRSPDASTVSPAECALQIAGTREVGFTGTGTFEGAPVTIVGISDRGRTIVFVVSSTNCADVLTSISR